MSILRLHVTLALVVLASALAPAPATAQRPDHRGHEFWIAFLENSGSGGAEERSEMRLYAAADRPATIRVVYHGTGAERRFALAGGGSSVTIDVRALFGPDVELTADRDISRRSLSVHSDEEITLHGVNVRLMSADAFLALPVDVLTRRYIVLAYQNGVMRSTQGFNDVDMPSEICVIATEDGTLVRVAPSAAIAGRGADTFTVGLDRGDVYFAQAALDGEWDLTGTAIEATKPVAVFAGSRRTAIPTRNGSLRNHLVEQIPPLELWGREAIVAPHYTVAPGAPELAIVRIIAAEDATEWRLDGVRQTPLARGRAIELPLTRAMRIAADRPVLVAQYEHSARGMDSGPIEFENGDPFMMIVPSPSQYDDTYAFESIVHPEFVRHFVNVVIPTASVASLRLDGAPIDASVVPIAGTGYCYIQHEVEAGAHTMTADVPFGLHAYGFGRANGYGYAAGMVFASHALDLRPPRDAHVVECGSVFGTFADDAPDDAGIDSCHVDAGTVNAAVEIVPFAHGAAAVSFSATLVDPFADGLVALRAVDAAGHSRALRVPVPGFTVRAVGAGDAPLALDTLVRVNGVGGCVAFELINDGAFAQTVDALAIEPSIGSIVMAVSLPLVLAPGETRRVEVCSNAAIDTSIALAVVAVTACTTRTVATIVLESVLDTSGPAPAVEEDRCAGAVTLHFRESPRASGIAAITFTTRRNCVIDWVTPDSIRAPVRSIACRIRALDPRADAFVAGTAVDLAGNVTPFAETIGGFVCALVDERDDTVSLARDRAWHVRPMRALERRCDTIAVVNNGARRLRIVAATLAGNRSASIPPSQLPFVVEPGSRRTLDVCFEAEYGVGVDDTLMLVDDCGNVEQVALRAVVPALAATAVDRCLNALSIRTLGPARRTFVAAPAPNPSAGGPVSIDVGLHRDGPISLELFDASGAPALAVIRGEPFDAGLHRIVVDVASLSTGRYFVRLRAAGEELTTTLAIVR